MPSHATEHLEVLVTAPRRLYDLLDDAESELRQAASPECCAGMLVTRHNPGRYTLMFSETVPFGETREQMLS
jgi:hypothetical protein